MCKDSDIFKIQGSDGSNSFKQITMIYGLFLTTLVILLWAPCLKKGLWAESGPVFAKDRKNRIFRITPTGECCKGDNNINEIDQDWM